METFAQTPRQIGIEALDEVGFQANRVRKTEPFDFPSQPRIEMRPVNPYQRSELRVQYPVGMRRDYETSSRE